MMDERRNHSYFSKLAWWIMGGLSTIVTLGGTAWVSATNERLANMESAQMAIGREVSELKAGQRAQEEFIRQIIVSLREVRDDVKILLREKPK